MDKLTKHQDNEEEQQAIKLRLSRLQTMFHQAPFLLVLLKVLDYENYRIVLANQTAVYISSYPLLRRLVAVGDDDACGILPVEALGPSLYRLESEYFRSRARICL